MKFAINVPVLGDDLMRSVINLVSIRHEGTVGMRIICKELLFVIVIFSAFIKSHLPVDTIEYRHLIPASVDRTSASAWLHKQP